MTDALGSIATVSALPPMADPMMGGGPSMMAMKMGPGVNIDKTAQDFEAMFATQMLQPMFEGIEVDPTFGGGHGEEIMRSFMLQEYGKIIAKTGKLGIAAQVKSEMLKAQESASGRGGSTRVTKNAYGDKSAYANAVKPSAASTGSVNVSIQ